MQGCICDQPAGVGMLEVLEETWGFVFFYLRIVPASVKPRYQIQLSLYITTTYVVWQSHNGVLQL